MKQAIDLKRNYNTEGLYRMPWTMSDNVSTWLEITRGCDISCEYCIQGHECVDNKTLDQVTFEADSLGGPRSRMHPSGSWVFTSRQEKQCWDVSAEKFKSLDLKLTLMQYGGSNKLFYVSLKKHIDLSRSPHPLHRKLIA